MRENGYMVFIGTPCVDEYYSVLDAWPAMGDKFFSRFEKNIPGGMIANAASVVAGFGTKAYILCQLYDDDHRKLLTDDLESYGIDTSEIISLGEGRNLKCQIFTIGGERVINIVLSAPKPKIANDAVRAFLCGADYVYSSLDNFEFFEDPLGMMRDLHDSGVRIVLDNESGSYRGDWRDYLKYCSIISVNEFALETFAEGRTAAELEEEMIGLGVEILVETLGENGCRIVTGDGTVEIPACDVRPIDTTGAGDTFNSSFTYAVSAGMTLKEAGVFATACAGRSVTMKGGRSGVATVDEVRAFAEEHLRV